MMETIFDHSPTLEEIEECGFLDSLSLFLRHGLEFGDPLSESDYRDIITEEASLFDLYLLFSHRCNIRAANWYAAFIPEKVQEYTLGFDYQITAVNR